MQREMKPVRAVVGVPLGMRVPRVQRFRARPLTAISALALATIPPVDQECVAKGSLTVAGQGIVTFTLTKDAKDMPDSVSILFETKQDEFPRLVFTLSKEEAVFEREDAPGNRQVIQSIKKSPAVPDGFSKGMAKDNLFTQYWISIDSWNKVFRFGKGEMRLAAVLVEQVYGKVQMLMDEEQKEFSWVKELKHVRVEDDSKDLVCLDANWTEPVVREPAVAVIADRLLTMDKAASLGHTKRVLSEDEVFRVYDIGTTTFSSLSIENQRLYGNIIGFSLESRFLQALEYSLRDPDGLGYKILKYKLDHPEFDDDNSVPLIDQDDYTYKEIYLRITLGSAQGDSPGVPYVMEIWPGGCGSPIHNHGGTYAIIKVLSGQIDIDLHRQLPLNSDPPLPLRHVSFQKDQITLITPQANQIHRLRNLKQHTSTCVTIQCYTYPDHDEVHDPFFHYVEGDLPTKSEGFNPLSDCDFRMFKAKVLKKWIKDGSPEMTGTALHDMWWQTYTPK